MADATKVVRGGLKAMQLAEKAAEEQLAVIQAAKAADRANAGRMAADVTKATAPMKMSEALGNMNLEGKGKLKITQADRTRVGGGNIGGPMFSGLQQVDPFYKDAAWGVGKKSTASSMINQSDDNTLWSTVLGSAEQLKTNPLVFNKLRKGFTDSMKQGNLSDELAGKINHNLGLVFGEGADIRDPKIWQKANTFDKRAALADAMLGQGIPPSKGGVALGGEKSGKGVIFRPTDILKKETEPMLLHPEHGGNVPTFAVGPRLFSLSGETMVRPDLHPGFPVILKGEDKGVVFDPVAGLEAMPAFVKRHKEVRGREPAGYYDWTTGLPNEGLPTQPISEEYLTYLQKLGKKSGGAISRKETEADMAQFHKRFALHKATGGKVDIPRMTLRKADGGKIAKGMMGAIDKAEKAADAAMAASKVNMPTARIGLPAPGIIIPGKINNVREAVRNIKGNYGARRVERAADEIPNLERMFQEGALGEAFTGDNASAMMTINPAHFEKFARELDKKTSVGPKAAEMAKQGDIDKMTVTTDEYIKHLQRLKDGFSDVPYLNLTKDEVGLPTMPQVIGHEGRHRNRSLADKGEESSLVKINPRGDLREGMPRRTQEEFIEALKQELDSANRLVLPEVNGTYRRPPVELPDIYAKGGAVGQESPEDMARFQKRFVMHKALGGAVKKPQKFDGGGIASPEENLTVPPDRETKAGLMAEYLAKAAKEQGKEELSSLKKPRAITDLLNRGVLANNPLSAGVDLFNLGLGGIDTAINAVRPTTLGELVTGKQDKKYLSSEKPFLGSEYVKDLMNKTGVTSGEERPMMETALSFASPTAMIKGAMKATDAAKKAPELLNKASSAISSSKLSPLATEAKTASAGKPTGATYATKQEGPFFRVSPTTLDTSKAKTRGIREADELQSPAPLGGGAGSIGRETPQLLSSEEVGRIIADPVANEPLNIAKKYTQETQGTDFVFPDIPESSLVKQSAIGRTQQLAVDGSPEYKTAVFDAYAQQMPDVLEQAGAKNYDDLMEKAYRQLAKETDDQFKALPYNFSYHRAGEGNYNGAMDMASDVHGNKHLYVYQGGDKHDFLNRVDPASGLNENEKFRAVHDLLGHAIYGNQFGPKGEEMAWAIHSQMYSPLARLAMTAETRGQNSMVNYSPLNANLKAELAMYDSMANEARRKGDKALLNEIIAAKRQAYSGFEFAPNKAVLLPPEFLSPKYTGGMPSYLEAANRPVKGTETQSVLTHFSNDPNLQMLDPKRYGTGIKGAEAERLREYPGAVKDRSYFYLGEPGTVAPEAGLGPNRYRGEASSLYDITQDPLNFQKLARESNRVPFTAKYNQGVTYPLQDANDVERLVKEYGYQGMANPKATKPMAIMFKETPVRRQARGGLTLMK